MHCRMLFIDYFDSLRLGAVVWTEMFLHVCSMRFLLRLYITFSKIVFNLSQHYKFL